MAKSLVPYKEHLKNLIETADQAERDRVATEALTALAATEHTFIKPVVVANRVTNGKQHSLNFCMECGARDQTPYWASIWLSLRSYACKTCGNHKVVIETDEKRRDEVFIRILDIQGDCIYFEFLETVADYNPKEDYDRRTVTVEGDANNYGVLIRGEKLFFYYTGNGDASWITRGCGYSSLVDKLKRSIKTFDSAEAETAYNKFFAGTTLEDVIRQIEQANMSVPKKKASLAEAVLPEVGMPDTPYGVVLARVKEETRQSATVQEYCPNCKQFFTRTAETEKGAYTDCPYCGTKAGTDGFSHSLRYSENVDVVWFDQAVVSGKPYLVIRVFEKTVVPDWDRGTAEESVKEVARDFLDEKSMKRLRATDTGLAIIASRINTDWEEFRCQMAQTPDEIRSVIAASPVRYSGLMESWLFKDANQTGFRLGINAVESYFAKWYKTPQIEKMVKCGLYGLARAWTADSMSVVADPAATTLQGFFGVTTSQLQILRSQNPQRITMKTLQDLFRVQPDLTLDEYNRARETINGCRRLRPDEHLEGYQRDDVQVFEQCLPVIVESMRTLKLEGVKIRLEDVAKYVRSCFQSQCIMPQDAINVWCDYLRMASCMYPLVRKNVRYPSSLKKEHDIAVFAYQVVMNEKQRQFFQKRARAQKWLEYADDHYRILIPDDPSELSKEHRYLGHCVESYIPLVTDGRTMVAFLRRAEEPDIPYYTIEVWEGRIRQVRGVGNCPVKEREAWEFLEKWAKAKNLLGLKAIA